MSDKRRQCAREGCRRKVHNSSRHHTCTLLCRLVLEELEGVENICRAVPSPELWADAVALSDALTAYFERASRVYGSALDVGITPEQWQNIRNGNRLSA